MAGRFSVRKAVTSGTPLFLVLFAPLTLTAQNLAGVSIAAPPPPLAKVPTNSQQQALQSLTTAQIEKIQTVITPQLKSAMQSHQSVTNFRTWQDVIQKGPAGTANSQIGFVTSSGTLTSSKAALRIKGYAPSANQPNIMTQPSPATSGTYNFAAPALHPIPLNPDLDQDGLNDQFEGNLTAAFFPIYHVSTGEQQQFASYLNSVPWTVANLVGTTPPQIYTHVSPLGLVAGTNFYAIRVDYLTLWNADGGILGGGAACNYSYFGLDTVIGQLSSHDLDAERSVMLLAAPTVNGTYDPNPNHYSLYSVYTAAHEGTFFDQSEYADFSIPVPAGNHLNLSLSHSKHSTYSFNPDFYPITPQWFIAGVNAAITSAYADQEIDYGTYLALIAAADDTFYGCIVERFGDQGGAAPSLLQNVGEVAHPFSGYTFIQDDSARALNFSDKLNNPIF